MNAGKLKTLSDAISGVGFEITGLEKEFRKGSSTGEYLLRISPAVDPVDEKSFSKKLERELKSMSDRNSSLGGQS